MCWRKNRIKHSNASMIHGAEVFQQLLSINYTFFVYCNKPIRISEAGMQLVLLVISKAGINSSGGRILK